MKKLLAVLLVVALALSMVLTVSAAGSTTKVATDWQKLTGSTDVTKSTEGGATVYTFGGVTAAYNSAAVNLVPTLQTLIKGKSSIRVKVTMDAKVSYADGYEGEDFPVTMLIRVGGKTSKVATEEDFKANFKDQVTSDIRSIDGKGNFGIVFEQEDILTDEWATIESPEFNITPDDLNPELWSQLNLCFHRMSGFEIAQTISIKNTTIEVVEGTTGNDKPTADTNNSGNTGNVGAVVGNDEDTPELPDGNLLEDDAWVKGIGAATVSKGDFKGQTTYVFKGMNSSYSSPYLNVYPAVKEAMGEDDEVTVWIVLDIRIANKKGNEGVEHKFGVKLRPGKGGKLANAETFGELYEGMLFTENSGNVVSTLLGSSEGKLNENWQRLEFFVTVYRDDLNDELFDAWNLCFDNMATFADITEIQVKNAGVFLEDDYEPVEFEVEDEDGGTAITTTPKPVTIYKPYNFDKYDVTFRDAVSSEHTPAPEVTPDADGNVPEVTAGAQDGGLEQGDSENGNGGSKTLVIIIVAAAVVVLAGAAAAFIIIKNKKGGKAE